MTDGAKSYADFVSRLLHSLGNFSGKPRLADYLGRVIFKLGHQTGTFALNNGSLVKIDLGDRIQRLMWGAAYEPHVKQCLSVLLRPGDIFVDVGAHVGYFSLFAAQLVGPTGRVFAFEGDPGVFQKLQFNGSRFSWLTPYSKAVWQRTGKVSFSNPHQPGETGWGKVAAVRNDGNLVTVEAISLDDWHRTIGHAPVRLLKIDAEGSEPFILDGARKLMSGARPYIVVELNDQLLRCIGQSQNSVSTILKLSGYVICTITTGGIVEVSPDGMSSLPEVFCVPTEHREETEQLFRS